MRIILAPTALNDIEAITKFIEWDSIDQAALFVSRIIEMTDQLEEFPQSGRIIPKIGHGSCPELIYGAYRIVYRMTRREIWITEVSHGARDWKPD